MEAVLVADGKIDGGQVRGFGFYDDGACHPFGQRIDGEIELFVDFDKGEVDVFSIGKMHRESTLLIGCSGFQPFHTAHLLDALSQRSHHRLFHLHGGMIRVMRDHRDGRDIDIGQQRDADLPDGEYSQHNDGQEGHQNGYRLMDEEIDH